MITEFWLYAFAQALMGALRIMLAMWLIRQTFAI